MGGGTSSGGGEVCRANGREPCGMDVEKQKASGGDDDAIGWVGGKRKKGKCWRHEEELEIGIRNWVEMETNGCNSRTK